MPKAQNNPMTSAFETTAPITAALARFAAETAENQIPEAPMAVMQLSLLDWVACAVAGADEPVSNILRDMVMAEGGAPQATVVGGGQVPARAAALANGAISHALDYDDTHFAHIGHPSVAVVSAALAVAEKQGASGRALQQACLIGVETATRVGVWLGRDHYQGGFHQTGTAGAFGAALAAARLMGFSAAQCEMTLGLVATRASGLKSQFGTMGKPYNAGIAASNGVEAAELVARGFVANPGALELAQGFGPTHMGQGDLLALAGLGQDWLFETVSHKFHACCHGLHAALEALQELMPLRPEEVSVIEVTTHPRWMSVCNQPAPMTGLGAKFSYSTVLAMALLGHDTARLDSYSDQICADPALQALRAKVRVTADDSTSETGTRLRLQTRSGMFEATHDLITPMELQDRKAKVLRKAKSLLGEERAQRVEALVASYADAVELGALLRG
ncbi:MmgE/PrpD family protein [Thalassovita sp.]|uniref:MmgE/PrpD family protein n=1 Tax=Thalassovita sp. TaxID=1979401 RepID=UPI002AB14858|nr:MmgE/PrpD family protein [Thalassovita sp.]